jgi:hypothetical protein
MEILNYSSEGIENIKSILPVGLKADRLIVFPDICKVRWRIPTGIAVLTTQENWRKFAISDVGCGMLLCKSELKATDFDKNLWNELYYKIKAAGKEIGDLGIGNHFIDALKSKTDENLYFLIHCGIDKDIELLENLSINNHTEFDNYYNSIIQRAEESRYAIYEIIQSIFGNLDYMFDRNHNHYENTEEGVIIRRGAVKITPNQLTVIPSNLCGEVALVKATDKISETLFSLSHGTGRLIDRDETDKVKNINYSVLREKLYIPSMIPNEKLKMDTPDCYRDLDSCLELINNLIQIEDKYTIIGYLGQINDDII